MLIIIWDLFVIICFVLESCVSSGVVSLFIFRELNIVS